ncbi:hypothetical protein MKW94_016142, partial [Papaver nudicaule]|nr:hypothetical protein [Papaver nudicaule]
ADMPIPLQNQAFRCAKDCLDSMPNKKLDSKRLALALKKVLPFLSLAFLSMMHVSFSWNHLLGQFLSNFNKILDLYWQMVLVVMLICMKDLCFSFYPYVKMKFLSIDGFIHFEANPWMFPA